MLSLYMYVGYDLNYKIYTHINAGVWNTIYRAYLSL